MIGRLFRIAGIVLLASGLLFMLQGWGIVRWPPESFMIDQRVWIWAGFGIAFTGAYLIFRSGRF